MAVVMHVKYQCQKCGEGDTVKVFPNETAPAAFNCWNCGSGREYGPGHIHEQVFNKIGMLPIEAESSAGTN